MIPLSLALVVSAGIVLLSMMSRALVRRHDRRKAALAPVLAEARAASMARHPAGKRL